ncbi:hypothetical protein PIB30_086712 [Stylosanthes scabra]|uniref:Uncharacterized protein n=1 Tax=Stylosanthes scabra TaxID=79078 RepID=A0ABU6TSP3_9FABA|nr:hypothetical protein [Stylosanthes scabra]
MRHATDPVVIQIVPEPDFHGNREYLDWWDQAYRNRRRRGGRVGDTGGPVRRTRTTRGEASTSHAVPSTSWAEASQQMRTAHRESPTFVGPSTATLQPIDQQTQPDVVHEPAEAIWEQLTSARLDDVWDVTRTSASVAHDIV